VLVILLFVSSLGVAQPVLAQTGGGQAPEVGQAAGPFTFTGDLNSLPQAQPTTGQKIQMPMHLPVPSGSQASTASASAPDVQRWQGSVKMPSPIQSFEGAVDYCCDPPDPNGDVGPNHFVEAINVSFAVYNKTGTKLAGPTRFTALFNASPSTGTPCDSGFTSDPIVLYDALADRWLLSFLAFSGFDVGQNPIPPFYECIAVSRTPDPVSGGWYKYALLADASNLNDYPKLGVWPDGYYMSANMNGCCDGGTFVKVWALNRDALLSGGTMNEVHFSLPSGYNFLLPSNLRGARPPAGRENIFAAIDNHNSQLLLWKFHVDWATPSNSTFGVGPTHTPNATLAVAAFSPVTGGVPQPGYVLNNASCSPCYRYLDPFTRPLRFGLQYRNIGGTEALWATHAIDGGGNVEAIRWYQVRSPYSSPFINQSGTYSPDSTWRWNQSLAVDRFGNMAVSYNVASTSIHPGIRYTGRLATDAAGTLPQGETTLVNGTASDLCTVDTAHGKTDCYGRWGDYSSLTVDPVDDCTFWSMNQYVVSGGYHIRVASFKFPACSNLVVDRGDDLDIRDCTSAANDCTLRGAINVVNQGGFAGNAITFAPAVNKVSTGSTLPALTASHITIQGSGGVPRIDAGASAGGDIFVVNGDDNRITGLSFVNGTDPKSDIYVAGGSHNVIDGNYLGTLPPSASVTNCTPNPGGGSVFRNSGYGVFVGTGTSGDSGTATGSAYIFNNTIGCHTRVGVDYYGASYGHVGEDTSGNASPNWVGMNANGVALPNAWYGIALEVFGATGAKFNRVRANTIANNGLDGIWLHGNGNNDNTSTTLNVVQGNNVFGNGRNGMRLDNGAFWNKIGGDQAGEGNNIYGNASNGIFVDGSSLNGILGNRIGSVAGGAANGGNGIVLNNSSSNLVGAMFVLFFGLDKANIIGGNNGDGVQIVNGSHDNVVTSNDIGTNVAVTGSVPNGLSGLSIFAGSYNNRIGDFANCKRNVIAGNNGYGIYISGAGTTSNTLEFNDVGVNTGRPCVLNTQQSAGTPDGAHGTLAPAGGGGLPIPNGGDGVTLQNGTQGNVISGSNWIGYNLASGMYVYSASNNILDGNNNVYLNNFYGLIIDGAGAHDNWVRHTNFYSNGYDGIGERNSAGDNRWSQISTYGDGGLGIDKSASSDFTDDVTPPFPVITSVVKSGANYVVAGLGNATDSGAFFANTTTVEVYSVAVNSHGFAQGYVYLGTATTDANGIWGLTLPSSPTGRCLVAFETNVGFVLLFPYHYSTEFGPSTCNTFVPVVQNSP
jgi:hypothetical protein